MLAVNPAYCALYGRPPRRSSGTVRRHLPEEERAAAEAPVPRRLRRPRPAAQLRARVQRPDGGERVVEARADFLVHDGERVAMVSAIRDVTERRAWSGPSRTSWPWPATTWPRR